MHVFFSVGEPSGDQHAAHLIIELNRRLPNLRTSGFGGPLMQQAGCGLLYRLTNLAVMGVFQVLPLIRQFYRRIKQAEEFFQTDRPDLVVLVDFPGFNWWIAQKAKEAGIPVIYYLPPQLWAWAPWRIRRVRKYVDLVLSGLTFETDWYAQRGIPVLYVGHPFFDEVEDHLLDSAFCREWKSTNSRTVALLPGSRRQEVTRNWPLMLTVARKLHALYPDINFLVANYKEEQREFCVREYENLEELLPISFFVGKTPEVIELADCAIMVSGSVSLEMLARRTPFVALYRTSWPTYFIGRLLVNCKFMSLPNLIAGRRVMPEYLSVGNPAAVTDAIVCDVDQWLGDVGKLQQAREDLEQIRAATYAVGATRRAADVIIQQLLLSVAGTPEKVAA